MISLEHVARQKVRIDEVIQVEEPAYDHEKQQRWDEENFASRRIYMKSSTQFDGERDKGGDDK
jgi:hypothetical protein